MSNCRYCETISQCDSNYPIRKATHDLNTDYPRCDWHWRFVCDICGKPRHFNGITWCSKTKEFICISCAVDHRLKKGKFWDWDYYYVLGCQHCKKRHPASDRLEFEGKHPWQVSAKLRGERFGLSPEKDYLPAILSQVVPIEENTITDEQIASEWDAIAERWDSRYSDLGDLSREYIIDPVIFKFLGNVNGMSILDAGCGAGYLSRLLAKKGARVTGVDLSSKFIEIARRREEEERLCIEYWVGSLSNLRMFPQNSFEIVVSNNALMDTRDYTGAFGELARVLRANGKLIFSIAHPSFFGPLAYCGWERHPADSNRNEDRLYFKVDRYFDRVREIWRWPPVCGADKTASSFHRPLSDYMNELIKCGFAITDFEEPVPSRKAMLEHPRDFANEADRIPLFLVIAAVKTRY